MERIALVDANSFIALAWKKDPNHLKSANLFNQMKVENYLFVTNNYLVSEVATVLLMRFKNPALVVVLTKVFYFPPPNLKMIQISKQLQLKALEIFSKQEKPKLSFPDCTLIAQALEKKIKTIFTFDKNIRKFPLLKKNFKFIP